MMFPRYRCVYVVSSTVLIRILMLPTLETMREAKRGKEVISRNLSEWQKTFIGTINI